MHSSRRTLIKRLLATGLMPLAWSVSFDRRGLLVVPEANAQWLEVAQLAIGAASNFTQSNSGMAAMLSNIRELQLETIRLLQDVILKLGEIQAALKDMPKVIQQELNFHKELELQQQFTNIADDFRIL
jgi:hypothetical protein